jgi:uncharacterized protein
MTTRLIVKVVPGASQDKIVGFLGQALKIRLHAPPEKGKANQSLIALLATHLNLPATNINICSGHTSRTKVVEIQGVSDVELTNKLARLAT